MRKLANLFLVAFMALMLASCSNSNTQNTTSLEAANPTQAEDIIQMPSSSTAQQEPELPFEGKMTIMSYGISTNTVAYYSARDVQEKYGEAKIYHGTWPEGYTTEISIFRSILNRICEDKDVRAIIVQGGYTTNIDKAIKEREDDLKDIFIPYIRVGDYGGEPADIAKQVDFVLRTDELGMGITMVHQAQKLGAKVLVHYSFPRHMEQPALSQRRELIKEECTKLGIEFVDTTTPDPTSDVGIAGAQQFILEDVPKMIVKYGKDTAFFSTDCAMQEPLIKAVIDGGAIYPSPCHPSPYHGFPWALDIEISGDGELVPVAAIVAQTKEILTEKNMLGRLSTWPIEPNMMFTEASAEYAIKWLNGEVPQEGVDVEVLKQLLEDYAGVEVYLTPYTDDETGETYDNYFLVRMDYITFE